MSSTKQASVRELWRDLGLGPNGYALCSMCAFAERHGHTCEDTDYSCNHRLWKVREWLNAEANFGGDCWGFRPKYGRETSIDILGACLIDTGGGWHVVADA